MCHFQRTWEKICSIPLWNGKLKQMGIDQTKFLNYFRGIALVPKQVPSQASLDLEQLIAVYICVCIIMFGETSKYLNFSIFNGYLQFNKIDDDLSFNKSPLDTLRRLKDRLSSLKSGMQLTARRDRIFWPR